MRGVDQFLEVVSEFLRMRDLFVLDLFLKDPIKPRYDMAVDLQK